MCVCVEAGVEVDMSETLSGIRCRCLDVGEDG